MLLEASTLLGEGHLNPRQFQVLNALIGAVMVATLIAGFVQLAQARALQMEVQQTLQSDSAIYDGEGLDIEKAKNKLNQLAKRAMVFLFIGFEWFTGIFFYLANRTAARLGPICNIAQRRDSMSARREQLKARKAFLEKVDSQAIKGHLRNGMEQERTRGSLPLVIAVLVIILGVCLGSVLLAEDAFGGVFGSSDKPATYYLLGYDVTGSTEHDQQENQRAIIRIIDSLLPGDEFQLMNITQETFSDPEYMIHQRMPSRAGYFKEEIRGHKRRLIAEFREKCESLSKSRPATSILDGLLMFSQLLKERQGFQRKLILISDMLQFAKDITPARIAASGGKVLREIKADGLLPDMTGIEVYVMGASTANVDAKTWMGVKRFWIDYFRESGATLKGYSIQRQWPLD